MAVAPDHRDAGFMAVYYGRQSIGVANRIDARNVDVVLDWPAGRVRDGMAMLLEDSLEPLGRAVGWRCRSDLARHTVSKPRWECFCYPSFQEILGPKPHEVRAKRRSHDNATLRGGRDGHLPLLALHLNYGSIGSETPSRGL